MIFLTDIYGDYTNQIYPIGPIKTGSIDSYPSQSPINIIYWVQLS